MGDKLSQRKLALKKHSRRWFKKKKQRSEYGGYVHEYGYERRIDARKQERMNRRSDNDET